MVARTTHDDAALPGVSVEPETVHVPETTDHEMDPPPLPPVAVRASVEPYVADVDVTVNVAWFARLIVMEVFEESSDQ